MTSLKGYKGLWAVSLTFYDGTETVHGVGVTSDGLVGILNSIGEPDGAMAVETADGVLIGVPASRVMEVRAMPMEVEESD
jgi:hypothetical protein